MRMEELVARKDFPFVVQHPDGGQNTVDTLIVHKCSTAFDLFPLICDELSFLSHRFPLLEKFFSHSLPNVLRPKRQAAPPPLQPIPEI